MHYIANSSTSPADRSDTVLTSSLSSSIQPFPQQTDNPFARIDTTFTNVFSHCVESSWETLENILAGEIVLQRIGDETFNLNDCLAPLGIKNDAVDVHALISGLLSVVQYDCDRKRLRFYHASLPDFLVQKARAQKHHIDVNFFATKLVGNILQETDITKRSCKSLTAKVTLCHYLS